MNDSISRGAGRPAVVLCGYMGSGKSTVGKRAAALLQLPYIDADEYIEQKTGMSIPAIFSRLGEDAFRDMEHQALKELGRRKDLILSAGGGALTYPRNVEILKGQALIIYLQCAFETCYSRICWSNRPIVRRSTYEQLQKLYQDRDILYLSCCDAAIRSDGALADAVSQLVHAIEQRAPA